MFNIAVIRLKDLVKYLLAITIIISLIIFAKRYFTKINIKNLKLGQRVSANISKYVKQSIEKEIPLTKELKEQLQSNKEISKENVINKMLSIELGNINEQKESSEVANNQEENSDNNTEEKNKKDENTNISNENEEKNIELATTNIKTEVVTKNPLVDAYTKKYKSVKIKNETNIELSDDILNYDNLKIDKSKIIIFHTHTCESYTSSEKYKYTPTGKYRTTDLKYSVARVGDELASYLEKYGINMIHDKTYHDYPSYNGSYSRSLKTVSNILKNNKADIIIDLHRDAIGSNSSYAPTVKIGEDYCAQLMFVMGSNGGGLKHPDWKNNLQFAIKMQEFANNTYPGLFKPIIFRNSRYNQHLSKAACIIEVGSTGNTLEQCLNSMKYLAEIINKF